MAGWLASASAGASSSPATRGSGSPMSPVMRWTERARSRVLRSSSAPQAPAPSRCTGPARRPATSWMPAGPWSPQPASTSGTASAPPGWRGPGEAPLRRGPRRPRTARARRSGPHRHPQSRAGGAVRDSGDQAGRRRRLGGARRPQPRRTPAGGRAQRRPRPRAAGTGPALRRARGRRSRAPAHDLAAVRPPNDPPRPVRARRRLVLVRSLWDEVVAAHASPEAKGRARRCQHSAARRDQFLARLRHAEDRVVAPPGAVRTR